MVMTNRITKQGINGMLKRLRENTGLDLQIDHSYGTQGLEAVVNSAGGVTDLSHKMSGREMYNTLYAINRVIEHMRLEKKEEEVSIA
jgi:hypothetical protein